MKKTKSPTSARIRTLLRSFAGALLSVLISFAFSLGTAAAQSSTNYSLTEQVFNAGGHPRDGIVFDSTTYRVTLDAIGESVVGLGQTSASYRLDAGFGAAYPPPGEVLGLRFVDSETLEWNAEPSAGTYNLYRDALVALSGLGYGLCTQQNLSAPTATDSDSIPAGKGFFYLATVENRLDEEGTKGADSSGLAREGNACP